MIGDYLKHARKDKSLGQISVAANLEKSYLSKIERGILQPKLDKLIPLSNAYKVPFVELLAELLHTTPKEIKTMINDNSYNEPENNIQDFDRFRHASEAQRAMLKCRIYCLCIDKYQSTDFAECFSKDIVTEPHYVKEWFSSPNNYCLDNKLPQIISTFSLTPDTLFQDMNVVLEPNEVKSLKIELEGGVPDYTVIVSGDKVFSKLRGLSLSSLTAIGKGLRTQIQSPIQEFDDKYKIKYQNILETNYEMAAFGGEGTESTQPPIVEETT